MGNRGRPPRAFRAVPPAQGRASKRVAERLEIRCGSRLKKRHVQGETRLPTKRMATACWAFIVAKSPPLQAAYFLGSRPLQGANSKIHPQLINNTLCIPWGQFHSPSSTPKCTLNRGREVCIVSVRRCNPSRVIDVCWRLQTLMSPKCDAPLSGDPSTVHRRSHQVKRPANPVGQRAFEIRLQPLQRVGRITM